MTQTTMHPAQADSSTKADRHLRRFMMFGLALLLAPLAMSASGQAAGSVGGAEKARIQESYGKIPLSFEPNRGQTDAQVQFLSRGQGYGLFLTPGEAVLSLKKAAAPETSLLRMKLIGANTAAPVEGRDRLQGTASYFIGHDAKSWAADVPTYGKVGYTGVYPGIDLVYYGNQRQLEYDFVVAPHADPKQIALSFTGASPRLDSHGDLVLAVTGGETSLHKPVVYQRNGDRKTAVEASYQIAGGKVTFALGTYDHARPLVIDPVLTYATYLGGSAYDVGVSIAADASGNAYIVGDTESLDFPLVNAYQSTNHDASNGFVVFVTKLNPAGTAVVYSTFLGGVADSHALGVAVNATGNAYVVGFTSAGDFPVTLTSFQPICGGNFSTPNGTRVRANGCFTNADTGGFVTMLSPSGTSLVYSTFLGGNGYTQISGIALDAAGDAYLGGFTGSFCGTGPYYPTAPGGYSTYQCFPTTANALQPGSANPTGGGTAYAFLAVLDPTGSTEIFGTLYGDTRTPASGFAPTNAYAVAVDASGNGYIAGQSGLFIPTTSNAYLTALANPSQMFPPRPAFVAKFNPYAASGNASLVYGTYLGSNVQSANAVNYSNTATALAADAAGNAYVAGYTTTCGYPTTAGAYNTVGSSTGVNCPDGFITKINPAGTGLVWSTALSAPATSNSSSTNTQLNSLSIGANGNIYVAGTISGNASLYPQVGSFRAGVNGGAVISELDPTGSKLLFSSFVSGYSTDTGAGVATDANGNMYLTGRTQYIAGQPTIPVTSGTLSTTYKGGTYDAFVVRIAPFIVSTSTVTLPTGTVTAGQSTTLSATVAGPAGTTTIPTGLVTFLSGSTTLGTGTLNASGVATYTAASLNATTYTVTASYPGDTNFTSSVSASKPLVVTAATPTVTLTAPASALVGASVTLSVAVSGTGATPTGTVTFKDGTATLGTGTLSAGAASFATTTLAAGAHIVTVSYGGDSIFATAVSASTTVTINVPAAIGFAAAPTSLTIVHGASGNIVITGTPVGGYTGTATFACGTLPTAATCVFAPASLTFSGNNAAQSTTLTISTLKTASLDRLPLPGSSPGIYLALLVVPMGFILRGRRKLPTALVLLLLTLGGVGLSGLTGCSGGGSITPGTTATTTPAGSYTVTVTVTATGGSSSLSIPVTVQ